MDFKTLLLEAYGNLFTAKLRSFLAVLGILVGTASVVAMVSSGQLATAAALEQFKNLGTNLLSITINTNYEEKAKQGTRQGLDPKKAHSLAASLPAILAIAPYTTLYAPLSYGGQKVAGTVVGATEDLKEVMKIHMAQGRFLSYLDNYSYYCVIGHDVYEELLKIRYLHPIGQQLRIGKDIFTIIGVAKPWTENSFMNASINRAVIITTDMARMLSQYAEINNVVLTLNPEANLADIETKIKTYMAKKAPDKELYIRNAQQLIDSMQKQNAIFTLYLGLIGSISLLVGGIGVMNIMLVSVVERRREIGIRKAVGARNWDIQSLFLIESVALSLFGGVLGVGLGILVSFIIAQIAHWNFTLFLLPPLIGFLVSVAVGIFFGFYPAYQASLLDPITTLRSD